VITIYIFQPKLRGDLKMLNDLGYSNSSERHISSIEFFQEHVIFFEPLRKKFFYVWGSLGYEGRVAAFKRSIGIPDVETITKHVDTIDEIVKRKTLPAEYPF